MSVVVQALASARQRPRLLAAAVAFARVHDRSTIQGA